MPPELQSRSQRFAEDVFGKVKQVQTDNLDEKKYGAMSHKLPVLIRTAGLAQALAFVEARGAKEIEAQRLLSDLAAVVGKPNLASCSRTASLREYMFLTQQSLEALLWFKRFAQSVLKVESGEGDNEEAL